jgi:integrase
MASITSLNNGRKRLDVVCLDGRRRPIRLGKMTMKQADTVRSHVEALVSAALSHTSLAHETAVWLGSVDDQLHAKLVKLGLAQPRLSATLERFVDEYIASRSDVEERTRINYKQIRGFMIGCFGASKLMRSFVASDGMRLRKHLQDAGLADNTIRRHMGRAKQFFAVAIKGGYLSDNPINGIPCSVRSKPERFHFVTPADTQKIIDACPDAQWRVIVALCRWGGLRCPSEVLDLEWSAVNWERQRITVKSKKTRAYEGKSERLIPLFPELAVVLREAFEQAEPGDTHVITRYRSQNTNLRTQLHRIIQKAGVQRWEKPFQNMRSSRETELAERYPIQVVTAWLGNSPAVAIKHYLQVLDEHFDNATQKTEAERKAERQSAIEEVSERQRGTSTKNNNPENTAKSPLLPLVAGQARTDQSPRPGSNAGHSTTGNHVVIEHSGAKSDAVTDTQDLALKNMSRDELIALIQEIKQHFK